MNVFGAVVLVIVSYVVGSVPFGLYVGRAWGKIDIRHQGSGNIGTTNVLRTLGPVPAALVLVLDAAKGWLPVVVAAKLGFGDVEVALAALAAVAGHSWSVFLNFSGGRGVATALGILIGLAPLAAATLVAVFAVLVLLTGYVSLGSIIASALLPVALAIFGAPLAYIVTGGLLGLVSVVRHLPNIRRLLTGTENRFGRPNPRQRNSSEASK